MSEPSGERIEVSLVVVNWNTKELLRKCLRSVWATTHEVTFEVLVVDNGSRDGSQEMVLQEFPSVRLVQAGSNLGFAKATNIGIRNSAGRYICLVNSDVVLQEGCIDKAFSYLEEHPSIGVLGPRILNPDLTLQPSCRGTLSFWNVLCRSFALDRIFPRSSLFAGLLMTYWPHDSIRSVDAILGCFWMVPRKALDEVGLLDERFFMYAEDVDWCQRCHAGGWEVVYFPGAGAIHYAGGSSSRAPVDYYVEANRSSVLYWKKHYATPRIICFLPVMFFGEAGRILWGSLLFLLRPKDRVLTTQKIKRSMACLRFLLGVRIPGRKQEGSDLEVGYKGPTD